MEDKGITAISVSGFKSLAEECCIDVRPLTILAGVNSSGKSSIIQPLLLMKQTLDEVYDPGDLKINGPNVRFTKIDQLLSRNPKKDKFKVRITIDNEKSLTLNFRKVQDKGIKLIDSLYEDEQGCISLLPGMLHDQILSENPYLEKRLSKLGLKKIAAEIKLETVRRRCFLEPIIHFWMDFDKEKHELGGGPFIQDTEIFEKNIKEIIHVPALRGNPQRDYDISATGPRFPGTFEKYVASIIYEWKMNMDSSLQRLNIWLIKLGLTNTVSAMQIDDTRVEISVGRMPVNEGNAINDSDDQVSIADVGYGVSQTLPVLVALIAAKPGQIVYIEQPEIHLHPKAQIAMAEVLAESARLGIRVIVETHSALLLRGIQTIIAKNDIIKPKDVKLHWFERDRRTGNTMVKSADLDNAGSFGDWPVDFGDILMKAEIDYIKAAEPHLRIDQ